VGGSGFLIQLDIFVIFKAIILTSIPVVFREPKDLPVLGATTLESLGYQLDPISKRLKPVELLMM
jgi:hypothetical protein